MLLEKFIDKVKVLDDSIGYWFVRTDSGDNFETFLEKDFIGIGWNAITYEDLKTLSPDELKNKIAASEDLDLNTTAGKTNATSTLNKLSIFKNLKKGDIIVIPSRHSSRYAFGLIQDNHIYNEFNDKNCDYYKRRKVKWTDVKNVQDLDPIFYRIKNTRHSISDISDYQNAIDNVTNSLYIKEGYGHFVLDINVAGDINVKSLLTLINSIQELSEIIDDEFKLDEDAEKSSIKLNLQSPGKVEIIIKKGITLIILAAVLSTGAGCNLDDNKATAADQKQIDTIVNVNQKLIDKINAEMDTLHVDFKKFTQNR